MVTSRAGRSGHRALLILDNRGDVVWYRAEKHGVNDLKVVTYQGQRMLAWHEYGPNPAGGSGSYLLMDDHYRIVSALNLGRGFFTDMHEMQLTRRGTVLLSSHPDWFDRRRERKIRDFLIREIDPSTGAVLFNWDARYQLPMSFSYYGRPARRTLWEPYHGNSLREIRDGNVLVSLRNTSAIYKLDRQTGAIIWTLGGRNDSFDLVSRHRSWQFCHQHDATELPNGHILLFDDGGSATSCPNHLARAEEFALDTRAHTVRLVRQFRSTVATPDGRGYRAWYVGSARRLSNGDTLVSWGQVPHVSEFTPGGRVNFDITLATWTYRAVREKWVGLPLTKPALAVRRHGRRMTVWASWNGATRVASWSVLGGPTPGTLARLGGRRRTGFETTLTVTRARYVAVRALDRHGHVIGQSKAIAVARNR